MACNANQATESNTTQHSAPFTIYHNMEPTLAIISIASIPKKKQKQRHIASFDLLGLTQLSQEQSHEERLTILASLSTYSQKAFTSLIYAISQRISALAALQLVSNAAHSLPSSIRTEHPSGSRQ